MKTTTKLALASITSGKIRSALTGIAIFLTTALITIISLGGYGMVRQQIDDAADTYGEHYALFTHVSQEEESAIKLHSQFHHIGRQIYAGEVILPGYRLTIRSMDASLQALAHITPESGRMPSKADEIYAQREFFQLFGLEHPNIGDRATIPLRINGEGEITEETFTISGFSPSSESNDLAKMYGAYVSEDFVQEKIPVDKQDVMLGFQVQNDERLGFDQMKEKILNLAGEIGITERRVSVNSAYLSLTLNPQQELILPCICIILIIMLVSALVIYNIFHVAIVQKIREFGRLKAIGADKKQLSHMVRMEGLLLSLVSIPAGILAGIVILKVWFSFWLHMDIPVFSLPLLLLVVALTLLTVFISLHKPIKIAAKTSPVESMRYEAGGRELTRKGKKNVTVLGLTLSNLSLQRKKTFMTILTMGLSCVLFVVVANIVGNIDGDRQTREDLEHGRFRIELDYSLDDKTYPENNLYEIQKKNPLGKDLIDQILAIEGVTGIRTRKTIPMEESNENTGKVQYTTCAIIDEEDFAWLVNNAERGTVEYETTAKNDGVIYMWDHFLDEEYRIGDTFHSELIIGDRRIPFSAPLLGSCGHSNDGDFVMTDATFEKLGIQEDMTCVLFVECSQKDETKIRAELETIIGSLEHVSMTCYSDTLRLLNLQTSLMKNVSYTFLIILGAIGFMNMANTMITNILTRKKEFGVMQAIGMNNRQLHQMLQLEGLVFTAGTIVISLVLGNLLGYLAFLKCKSIGMVGLFEYHVPFLEVGCLILGIIVLQTVLAFVLSHNVKRESLVEKIRCE